MIVDLNLKGKQVVVVGGGDEAERKVIGLLTQDCEIVVVADHVTDEIKKFSGENKITLKIKRVNDGKFLRDYDRLILVMAVTNDKSLNRTIVEEGKNLRCYVYSADDPENSDFSHPSIINLHDTVQVAISTGGKSPLMAKKIRQKLESPLQELISEKDSQMVQLQGRLRPSVKEKLATPETRRKFLAEVLENKEINALLSGNDLDKAESAVLKLLDEFIAQ